MSQTPTTRNEAYGFYGTIGMETDAEAAFDLALQRIAARTGCQNLEVVRDFLDSRHGRHFADDVVQLAGCGEPEAIMAAIDETIDRWQGWRFNRLHVREFGTGRRYIGRPMLESIVKVYAGLQALEIAATR